MADGGRRRPERGASEIWSGAGAPASTSRGIPCGWSADDGGHLLAFSFDADAPGRSAPRRCSWNVELEQEVALLRTELEAAQLRAEAAEEAEEQLCVQLREAKCETLELAHAYQGHVQELTAARSR
ncbi:protein RESPONSE TO LOW SULFUR 1 [Triticum aestivum]|uniref:protein RESPONSE TO LOW SULFUR 1 n=1 Tax=Triticum aestivum TaxID=4565 RepID=UPI001D02448E|nr:protein RESPONSE TO LOW SULFUR 1-like [Triticum aestivum]